MSEKKNIDRLFQEKFKDFEMPPSPMVWKGIEAKLNEEKEDRKILPIWFRFAGVAAALLIGLVITDTISFTTDETIPNNKVVIEQHNNGNGSNLPTIDTDGRNSKNATTMDDIRQREVSGKSVTENGYETGIAAESKLKQDGGDRSIRSENGQKYRGSANKNKLNNTEQANQPAAASVNRTVIASGQPKLQKKDNSNADKLKQGLSTSADNVKNNGVANADDNDVNAVAQSDKKLPTSTIDTDKAAAKNLISEPNDGALKNTIAAELSDDIKTDTTAIATVVPNTLEELLNEKENKTVTTNEPKLNRWQISTNVAPIYFSSTSNNSPIDSRLAQSSKEYKADLTYGVGVRYALNRKFTVRAGVNTVGMEYQTNDLSFIQSTEARSLQNVSTNVQGTLIHIEAKTGVSDPLTLAEVSDGRKFSSSLSQRTGYIEVPLEMSYKLVDKKFAIELIGGFSTLFLNENSVSIVSSGLEMEIGKANNLNDMHFSTNVGVGLRYNFLKNFQFNVEPMFKYQLNTFSHSSNYNPYMFGLYTGLNYRF